MFCEKFTENFVDISIFLNEADDDQEANVIGKRRKISHGCGYMNVELWNAVKDRSFWEPFDEYVENCRINANVRQVLGEGETSL